MIREYVSDGKSIDTTLENRTKIKGSMLNMSIKSYVPGKSFKDCGCIYIYK